MYRNGNRALLASIITVLFGCALPRTGSTAVAFWGSQEPIEYTVSLPAPQTQMVEISMRLPDIRERQVDVSLPVWRPGRYEVLELAGTVRQVEASSATGRALPIEKIDKSTWRIQTDGASDVIVRYRVYANSLGNRTRHVDDTHAFLSGTAAFFYNEARRSSPVIVRVEAPEGWSIAGGLEPHPDLPNAVIAPNYDVLVDSPLEIGLHNVIHFDVDDTPHEIVIWPVEVEYDEERLGEDFTKIVESQRDVFGVLPYERYVFLIHAGRGAGGGTEHLNSTIMQTSEAAIEGSQDNSSAYQRFLGLVSHEFFHTWNVKQLRPAGMHPYDYAHENYTRLLWVAEGTTSYYDDLTLARTGQMKEQKYFDTLARSITSLRRSVGATVQSLDESSFDAWIKFNKSSPDDSNTEISFYSKGALVSLLLDLEIRARTDNTVTLDDVMRAMFEQFPLSGAGYNTSDLIGMCDSMTASSFADFFQRYVAGTEPLPFEDAFGVVGMELYFKPADRDTDDESQASDDPEETAPDDKEDGATARADVLPMRATLGLSLSGSTIRSMRADGVAWAHGFMVGDELVALNEQRVSATNLSELLEDHAPRDTVTILYFRRDELRETTIALGAEPDGAWALKRVAEPTEAQEAAFRSWLKRPEPEPEEGETEAEGKSAGD